MSPPDRFEMIHVSERDSEALDAIREAQAKGDLPQIHLDRGGNVVRDVSRGSLRFSIYWLILSGAVFFVGGLLVGALFV